METIDSNSPEARRARHLAYEDRVFARAEEELANAGYIGQPTSYRLWWTSKNASGWSSEANQARAKAMLDESYYDRRSLRESHWAAMLAKRPARQR